MKEQQEITLEQILYKIKIENNDDYYYDLLENDKVVNIIYRIVGHYSFDNGNYLINKDFIEGIVESSLLEITWRYFKIDKCQRGNIEKAYTSFLNKFLNNKVLEQIKNERICKEELIGDKYDIDELFCMNYNIDFDNIDDDDSFSHKINNLNHNQKNVIEKIYKNDYTERELANENNVSNIAIHKTKKRALNNLKLLEVSKNGIL